MERSAASEVSIVRSLMPTFSKCRHSPARSRPREEKIAEWSLSLLR